MAEPAAERFRWAGRPATLLARTNLILGVSALLIAAIATIALYTFVIVPISAQSADDEAALLVLSAQTWVELPPAARPYFELEMAESHDLIISEVRQPLPGAPEGSPYFALLSESLAQRLQKDVLLLAGDDLLWVDVSMGGHDLQLGFSPQREDIQPLYGAFVIVALTYFIALLIRFTMSRKREYMADAGAVELTKNPDAMIRALQKISGNAELTSVPDEVREMAIYNPKIGFSGMFTTHPPIENRIKALVEYAGGRVGTKSQPNRSPWG